MYKQILSLALAAIFAVPVLPQSETIPVQKDDKEKLRTEAIAFLRETLSDVSTMRTLENRISFSAELAALMWYHDDREARQLFGAAVNDFKALLQQYDMRLNALGPVGDASAGFNRFSLEDPGEGVRMYRKVQIALGVRQQIAISIAEHEPEIALNFFYDSVSAISNPEFKKRMESSDRNFELRLLSQIAETNTARAVELSRRSVEAGITPQLVELLMKIYSKDQDKAIEFGSRLLSRAKETKPSDASIWGIRSLIAFGDRQLASRAKPSDKPVYSAGELRELADLLGRAYLETDQDEYSDPAYELLDKYAPGRANQLRSKLNADLKAGGRDTNRYTITGAPPPNYRGPVNTVAVAPPPPPPARGTGTGSGMGTGEPKKTERELAEEKLMQEVAELGTKELPKEERDRIIGQARKILNETPGREKKIVGLGMLAGQARKAGDQELASEIMRDAAALVRTPPKTYQDFMLVWMLATGYTEADPDKAFSTLEEAVLKANDLIASFVRIGEFIDVGEEMIVDGEVQVGAFGGGMLAGVTREIGVAESTVSKLVRADFEKTKALSNRFDRPEIRVLAKMMILRAVLGAKKETIPTPPVNDEF